MTNSSLDIWVTDSDTPIHIQTRGADNVYCDITPAQAIDIATELLNCVRRVNGGMPMPKLMTTSVSIVPGQPFSSPYTEPVKPPPMLAKPKRKRRSGT